METLDKLFILNNTLLGQHTANIRFVMRCACYNVLSLLPCKHHVWELTLSCTVVDGAAWRLVWSDLLWQMTPLASTITVPDTVHWHFLTDQTQVPDGSDPCHSPYSLMHVMLTKFTWLTLSSRPKIIFFTFSVY